MLSKLVSFFFFFFLGSIKDTLARPDGAPIEACINMIPNHQGIQPLSIPPPFAVVVEKTTLAPGQSLTVSLSAGQYRYFKGFLLIAVSADNNKIGTFATNYEKYVTCGASPYSAVTHAAPNPKSNIEVQWTAPVDFQGSVVFLATFVENFANFWVGQQSQVVTISSNPMTSIPVTQPSNHLSSVPHLDFGDQDRRHSLIYDVVSQSNNRINNASSNLLSKPSTKTKTSTIYEGCDVVKGCYGEPRGCVTAGNCLILVTFQREDNDINFQLVGPSGGWVALGFSKDRFMGDDSVVECVQNQKSGLVEVFTSFNHDHLNARLERLKDGLTRTQGAIIDGQISCSFIRQGSMVVKGVSFDLIREPHHFFLARGFVQEGTPDVLQQHLSIPFRSEKPVDVTSVSRITSTNRDSLIFIHGCLMIISWVGVISVAVFLARFYKYTWVNTTHCGEQVWFTWHRALNVSAVMLCTLAIIVIVTYVGGWSSVWRQNAHPILGLITFILMWMQPIAAMFRPHPGTSNRPVFNWFHFLVGSSARVFALATLFLADGLQKIRLLTSFSGVLITYIVFDVGCNLVVEVYSCIKAHSGREQIPLKEIQAPQTTNPESSTQKSPDAPGSSFRKLFLAVHVVGITALTMTLVIIVAASSEKFVEM